MASPPRPHEDAETIRLLKERDQGGLRRLLEQFGPRVNWYLRREFRRSLGEAEIEEAITLAAHRVWKSADQYEPEKGGLQTWFYAICRNAALRLLERETRERRFKQVADWDAASFLLPRKEPDGEPSERHRRFLENLRHCIEELPPLQMGIIKADLATGEVADAGELARSFNTTKNSIYASRSIARKTLKRALIALGHFAEPAAEASRQAE